MAGALDGLILPKTPQRTSGGYRLSETPSLDKGLAELDKMMRQDANLHHGLAEIDRMMRGPKRETKRECRKRQKDVRRGA